MPKFCANLAFLFTERPMHERFAAAASAGFSAVEFPAPYDDVEGYAALLREHGLRLVLFNLPMGDFTAGERGYAIDPNRRAEFRAGVQRAVEAAQRLECSRINVLAGIRKPGLDERVMWATLVENVRYAAARLHEIGATLMVEPLNALDTPGFFIDTTARALRLLDEAGAENARLQFDCYHVQRGEGSLLETFSRNAARIGHVQIADSPDRHQPGTGELAYERILPAIDASGYDGWVGLEYRPLGTTEESLGWVQRLGLEESAGFTSSGRKTLAAQRKDLPVTYRGLVYPWECDHMGHMNVAWYTSKFDQATWSLFASIGITPTYVRETKHGMAAVQQTIVYKRELVAGDIVLVRSRVLEVREKVIRFCHELINDETNEVAATSELTGVHLDLVARKGRHFPPEILERARAAAAQ